MVQQHRAVLCAFSPMHILVFRIVFQSLNEGRVYLSIKVVRVLPSTYGGRRSHILLKRRGQQQRHAAAPADLERKEFIMGLSEEFILVPSVTNRLEQVSPIHQSHRRWKMTTRCSGASGATSSKIRCGAHTFSRRYEESCPWGRRK